MYAPSVVFQGYINSFYLFTVSVFQGHKLLTFLNNPLTADSCHSLGLFTIQEISSNYESLFKYHITCGKTGSST